MKKRQGRIASRSRDGGTSNRRGKREERRKTMTRVGDRKTPDKYKHGSGAKTDVGHQQRVSPPPQAAASPARGSFTTQAKILTAAACTRDNKSAETKNASAATNSRAAVVARHAPLSTPPLPITCSAAVDNGKPRTELVVTHSEPGLMSFIAMLVLTTAATLCKEVGVTVFGLLVGAEIVRFLEWRCRRQVAEASDVSGEMAHFVTHERASYHKIYDTVKLLKGGDRCGFWDFPTLYSIIHILRSQQR